MEQIGEAEQIEQTGPIEHRNNGTNRMNRAHITNLNHIDTNRAEYNQIELLGQLEPNRANRTHISKYRHREQIEQNRTIRTK